MDSFRTMILPASATPLAQQIAATLSPAARAIGTTPLSQTGATPATHYISTGQINPEFAHMVPCQTWEQDEEGAWVETSTEPGNPQAVTDACNALGMEVTLEQVEAVFAGVRFTSGNAGCLTDSFSGTRLYNLIDGTSRQFGISAGMAARGITIANTTNVETVVYDGASSSYRRNGTLVRTGDTGFGTISNSLVIGRSQFNSPYLNGRFYGLIIRGAQSTTEQITQTETWFNGKTKAY